MTFDETVKLIESWGSDYKKRFGGTYNGGICLQQESKEMANLVLLFQSYKLKDISYLEIGCAAGGSTYVMNHFLDLKNIILIDDNKHSGHVRLKKILKYVKYNKIVGDSQSEQTRALVLNLNLQFDIIFIDADHSYRGVKRDTLLYLPFLKEGGFMAFHDVEDKHVGIRKWLDEVRANGKVGLKHITTFAQYPNRLGIGVYQK